MDTTNPTMTPAMPDSMPPVPAAPVIKRSPGLAVLLSMLPGLGHLYLGLYRRGILFFAAWAVTLGIASHSHLGVISAFVWFFALIDAYRCAQAINLGQCAAATPRELRDPKMLRAGNLGFGLLLLLGGVVLLYNQFYPIDFTFAEEWWPLAIVVFGVYLIAKHFWDRRQRAEGEPYLGDA